MAIAAQENNEPFELRALTRMLRIRLFEQKSIELSQTKPPIAAGSIHPCAGQEAIPVGAMEALQETDRVVATYRGHGWALEAGVSTHELLAELCHREAGLSGGRGGSLYAMSPHRRFVGENSIVGAGAPIAAGIALAMKREGKGRVAIVSVGDGAMSQGALHEGIVFAAAYDLPVIFVCENNGWSEMTPTSSMVKVDRLSRRAHGYGIAGATINGSDVISVRNTIAMAAEKARTGSGPSLIECLAPRLWGHYNKDIEHYRSKADRQKANDADPIKLLAATAIEKGLLTEMTWNERQAEIAAEIEKLAREVSELPQANPDSAREHIYAPRMQRKTNVPAAKEVELTYVQAINTALKTELQERPEAIIYGEDVGVAGGVLGATRNLQREFGVERVFDTPIAESAILGSAIGASLMGMRPIVEIMWGDFMLVGIDQLINHAANVSYLSLGQARAPIVVRTQHGATPGSCAQHSQCLEALLAHIPGLRVGIVSSVQDAYSMLRAAVACGDPTILFEARTLYQNKSSIVIDGEIEDAAGAKLRRKGKDVGLIVWGTMIDQALVAADELAKEGIEAGVLDLRWLTPLDEDALYDFVRRSGGRIVVSHEANVTGGFGAEIAARIQEMCWSDLVAPVRRVGLPDVRMPASPALQGVLMPDATKIREAAESLCAMHPKIAA